MDKGRRTPAVSRPVHGLYAISPYSAQPGLTSPVGVRYCLQAGLSYSFLPVFQVFARVISVLQCAGAVKVNVGLSISEYYIPI